MDQMNLKKDKDLHIRIDEVRFKKMAKFCIDLEITRSHFLERSIDFYLEYLGEETEHKVTKNNRGHNGTT